MDQNRGMHKINPKNIVKRDISPKKKKSNNSQCV